MPFAFFAMMLSAILSSSAAANSAETPGGIAGQWDCAITIGDDLSGPITVSNDRAEFAGVEAPQISNNGERSYRFSNRGVLRVEFPTPSAPVAFWVQPTTVSGGTYATPVALRATGPNTWRGTVEPLPDAIRMSLHIEPGPSGTLAAYLRDPLYNLGRRFGMMTVAVVGNNVRLTGSDTTIAGAFVDANSVVLTFPKESGIPPLTFTRRLAADGSAIATVYREPVATGDGWDVGDARDAGLSIAALESLTSFAAATVASDSAMSPSVHSIAIARHGKLAFDEYFDRFAETTLHDTRSAGKTYADLLAGAAMQAGAALTSNMAVAPLFSRSGPLEMPDPRKNAITLGNALSMSTGLDCDDNDDHSPANEDTVQNQTAEPDWNRLLLDTRMVRDPGSRAVYCSLSINLAGQAVAAVTGAWLPAYFAEHVAEPLEMQRYALNLTPGGDWYLGGGSYIRPRDFLKVGQVFLDGGVWHGRRIVPKAWVNESWQPRSLLGEGDEYGYAWHVRSYDVAGTSYRTYEAQGNGGQILDVIPQLDLAVMITQGNYNNFRTWGPERDAIVTRIIAATQNP